VLKLLFKQTCDYDPIGIQNIFTSKSNMKKAGKKMKRAYNYENSSYCGGHMDYMQVGNRILANIPHSQ